MIDRRSGAGVLKLIRQGAALATSIVAGLLIYTTPLRAQCSDWSPAFAYAGSSNFISALTVFDDGNGAALYAAPAGTASDYRFGYHPLPGPVSRWTGTNWVRVGTGLSGFVHTLMSYDAGSGPALYAGGYLSVGGSQGVLARWDGSNWTLVASGSLNVNVLAVYDDGAGPALYAGGYFWTIGGVSALGIAKWDGSAWSALGSGITSDGGVQAMAVFDDGTGPALYVGGQISSAGGIPAAGIARWSGSAWSGVGAGVTDPYQAGVSTLIPFDFGSGPVLCAGGYFSSAGGQPANNFATWSGSAWGTLGTGIDNFVNRLTVITENGSPVLVAGGGSTSGYKLPRKWDGSSWVLMGDGLGDTNPYFGNGVSAFATYDDGAGPELIAGGTFQNSGTTGIHCIARWTGSQWRPFGAGPNDNGADSTVRSAIVFNDGTGDALWIGGRFVSAGDTYCQALAKSNGTGWSSVGWGSIYVAPEIHALRALNLGSGQELIVGAKDGVYRRIAGAWTSLGFAVAPVRALEAFDAGSGTRLYAGGTFQVMGGVGVNAIASWDGTTWSRVAGGMNGEVSALQTFDDGSGNRLYVGGAFTHSGGLPTYYLARWDGIGWASVGGGLNGHVYALAIHDEGSGPALYAGGAFTLAGGVPANRVARWNGTAWNALGSGIDGFVYSMLSFDDGSGPALYATGTFSRAGSASANSIAKWNGASWSALGSGINELQPQQDRMGSTLAVYDAGLGSGPHLYVGGSFGTAGDLPSSCIAEWGVCVNQGVPMCFGDGAANPCPCANSGAAGHGCANSVNPSGARLDSSGSTSPDTIVLASSGEPPGSLSVFLQGRQVLVGGIPFGDGLLCASDTLVRLFARTATTGTVWVPMNGDPSIHERSAMLGDPILPGERRYYQTLYRDRNQAFCPAPAGSSFNITNAVRISW